MRRALVLFAVCALLAVTCGCSARSEPGQSSDVPSSVPVPDSGKVDALQSFSLSFCREDTLDPYAAKTEVNLQLATLLYDSLTVIDDGFMPQLSLAAAVNATDATHLEVTLRDGAMFSDGSAVTADDVAGSFRLARESANTRAAVANIVSAETNKKRPGVIVFTLSSPDPNAAACLSFPVVKIAGRATEAAKASVGGGLYCLHDSGSGYALTANPKAKTRPRWETVGLRDLPNASSMYYGLASGAITYYYNDLSSGELPRTTGASAAVEMNALVFLGVNGHRTGLNDPAVRRALSLLIDRRTLVSAAGAGWARPATMPFHPRWRTVAEVTGLSESRDLTAALTALGEAGYGTGKGQKKLKLELIYCSDTASRAVPAEALRSALEGAGLQITVTPLGFDEYRQRLSAGRFDLYLGEIRLTASMDLSPLLGSSGAASFGISADGAAAAAYRSYRAGETDTAAFTAAFCQDLPYIPLYWRCAYAGYDRRLSVVTPHGYNAFYGFGEWR